MSPTIPSTASPFELALMARGLSWLRKLVRPVFVGEAHLPAERPLLFVGNHTLGGVVDVPQLFFHMEREHGIFLRFLGEKAHWQIPGWRRLIERFGAVDGHKDNAAALFAAGHCVLVFPGGAREAFKRGDQRYQLLWGERIGFARLAARHGVTIVPFAAVGADDVWDVLADQDAVMATPVGDLVRELGVRKDVVPPILKGQGPLGLPGIRRQYFAFMEPVETRPWGGRDDDEAAWEIRRLVEARVEAGIDQLLALRDQDPEADWKVPAGRSLARRMVQAAGLADKLREALEAEEARRTRAGEG
ncbi:acyltransferase family protein [Myxococcota bacterium]|nr:acyltransferase family protein [Myxococcota bacterium]